VSRTLPADPVRPGAIRVDRAAGRAWAGERELDLSRRELDLLAILAERAGVVVTREELMGGLWDDARTGSPASVNVHVMHLRRKLGDSGPHRVRARRRLRTGGVTFSRRRCTS
jgi:DNA-binding response OmpR family regulator